MLADGCLLGIIYGTATENSVKTIPWLSYDVAPGASLCDTLVPPHPLSEECVVTMCDTAQILSQAKSGEASRQGQRVKFSSQVVTPVGTPAQMCYARFVKCQIIYNPGPIIYKSRKFSDF